MIKGLKAKGLKAVTLTTMFAPTPDAPAGGGAYTTSTAPAVTGGDAPPVPDEGA